MATKGRKPSQLSLFDSISDDAKNLAVVATTMRRRKRKGDWRGMCAVPPGSLLETVISEFETKTNIALEIPFATFLHYVSCALIEHGTTVMFQGDSIEVDVWSIVLAPSGGGKTWTQKKISAGLDGVVNNVLQSGAASAAAWIEQFSEKPRALWVRDEFYQLLKQIEVDNGPLSDLKDYLLRIYDNSKIERKTKKETITIDSPVLSILGFTALNPFIEGISAESLLDGFCQRFAFVLAHTDERRPWQNYPVWSVNNKDWSTRFKKMVTGLLPRYIASDDAEAAFLNTFKKLSGGIGLDESFYRRVMWRAHKYAAIYHIIRGEVLNEVLTAEDYGWAARWIEIQLADTGELLEMCSKTDISRAIDAADEIIKGMRAKGELVTARAIVSKTRLINNVALARFILAVLCVKEGT